MRLIHKAMKKEIPEKISGFHPQLNGSISTLKKRHYRIIKGTSVAGDAPKELIRAYHYEQGKSNIHNPKSWPIYIAKTGHKWYPSESISEYLLNRIGSVLGLNMAESKLQFVNGQIRFLSKLFRNHKNQILEHGAELYSGYLGDKEFVEDIEKEGLARDFFTVSFTFDALKHIYPHQAEDIFLDFAKMLVYDAIIGNNDRHFYNWGVLKHLKSGHQPRFSPIYDTARAFFWNRSDKQLQHFYNNKADQDKMIHNYVLKSKPKIGIEKKTNCNHLDIVQLLSSGKFNGTKDIVVNLINEKNAQLCNALIQDEFGTIISKERLQIITNCINLRFKLLIEVVKK